MIVCDYVEVCDCRTDDGNTNEDTIFFECALSCIRDEFESDVEQEAGNAMEE